jgi:hypothetical protein
VIDVLVFLIAIPVAIELIAAAYGPLDLARHRRLAALAVIRLVVMIVLGSSLVWWRGRPFVLGMCAYGVLFVAKHLAARGLGPRRLTRSR